MDGRISKRKHRRDESPQDESDSESDQDQEMFDFDFYHPVPDDCHDISGLCRRYLGDWPFHSMELADLIIEQAKGGNGIGSVVTVNESEEVMMTISAIDLVQQRGHECIAQITEALLVSAQGTPQEEAFTMALSGESRTGLLLCERLYNMPSQLTATMYRSLASEIQRAITASPSSPSYVSPPEYRLDNFVIVTSVCRTTVPAVAASSRRKGARKGDDALFYLHLEDEVFARNAKAKIMLKSGGHIAPKPKKRRGPRRPPTATATATTTTATAVTTAPSEPAASEENGGLFTTEDEYSGLQIQKQILLVDFASLETCVRQLHTFFGFDMGDMPAPFVPDQ